MHSYFFVCGLNLADPLCLPYPPSSTNAEALGFSIPTGACVAETRLPCYAF